MSFKSFGQWIASFVSVAFASYAVFQVLTWRTKKDYCRREVHEVIMFSEPTVLIQSKFSRSPIPPSMDRLLYFMNMTRHTLDICMYLFTNQQIAVMIQKLIYKRVKVRLIIDPEMAYSSGSVVRRLEKQGVDVRWMKSTNYMHHKYCLIDATTDVIDRMATPFVMAGSLNWTNQGLSGNWEDVMVTSEIKLVEGYREEFEKLWLKFKPIVR